MRKSKQHQFKIREKNNDIILSTPFFKGEEELAFDSKYLSLTKYKPDKEKGLQHIGIDFDAPNGLFLDT